MGAVERLQAAIDKLETLKQESFDGPWVAHHPFSYSWIEGAPYAGMRSKIAVQVDEPDAELIVTLHRTIDAQLAILRDGVRRIESWQDPDSDLGYDPELDDEYPPSMDDTYLALADAILGGAS